MRVPYSRARGLKSICRRIVVLIVTGLAGGGHAASQEDTSGLQAGAAARGFRPDAAYEIDGFDSVNLLNGNLTLSVPMGQKYSANGNLEYGLVLAYNSNVWDLREVPWPNVPPCGPRKCTPPHWIRALPSPLANAGLGWTLSLGRLFAPHDPQSSSSRTLTVETGGSGTGLVVSSPAGIHCGAICSAAFPTGSTVSLLAVPSEGSVFSAWAGPSDCLDGIVTLDDDLTCSALFEPGSGTEYELGILFDPRGRGTGVVRSSPVGIDCPPTCEAVFPDGTDVDLTAEPNTGSQFTQWRFGMGSECTGTEVETHVVMSSDRLCEARFDEVGGTGPYSLTVAAAGPFGGTVHVTLPGQPTQNCFNTTCTYTTGGQDVVLIADTPASCSLSANYLEPECEIGQVVMTGDKSCTAVFPRDPSCPVSPTLLGEPVNESGQWMYASPDGAKHLFYDLMHPEEDDGDPNVHYTRDNSFLRLKTAGARKILELPNGSKHYFDDVGSGIEFRLTRVEDAFGNWLDVVYSIDAMGDEVWDLRDSTGREHRVRLAFGSMGWQVEEIELAAFGGRTATYDFVYEETAIERDCRDTDPATSSSVVVPLLVEVRLPEGGYWDFRKATGEPRYATECAGGGTVLPPSPPPGPGKFKMRVLPFGLTGNEGWVYSDTSGVGGGISCTLEQDGSVSGICEDDFDESSTVSLTAVPQGLSTDAEWFMSSSEECLEGEGTVTGVEGETYDCNARFWCDPATGACGGICTLCPSCCICIGEECFPVAEPSGLPEPNGDGELSGALLGARLPTGGQVEWDYGLYFLPQKNQPYVKGLAGVVEKRHLDASGSLIGRWTFR